MGLQSTASTLISVYLNRLFRLKNKKLSAYIKIATFSGTLIGFIGAAVFFLIYMYELGYSKTFPMQYCDLFFIFSGVFVLSLAIAIIPGVLFIIFDIFRMFLKEAKS